MQRFRLVAWALLVATAAPAGAKEIWEAPWVEVRSEHFVLASALSEKRSIELALELENFRSAVDLLTGAAAVEDPIPTKIYVLPRAEQALGFTTGLGGYFHAGMRANYAVMIPLGSSSDEVLKHEYTHYLIGNRDYRQYPAWLNEGLAEVFATLRVEGPVVEFGRVPEGRMDDLGYFEWISFRGILSGPTRTNGRAGAMFYAQSWLLVHYLMVGRGSTNFHSNVVDYLDRLAERERPLAAFEAAFELNVDSLERQLIAYGRKIGFYRFTLKNPFAAADLETREIPVDEVAAEVGHLALMRGNYADAKGFYEAALAENADNADALVGMADLHKFEDRYDEAMPFYERALAVEPNDAEHLLDYAEYFLDRAQFEESADARRQLLVEARRQFARSYQLDPSNPETLAQNGITYLIEGGDIAKGVQSLEQAHSLLPSQPDIQAALAQAYIAAREPQRARVLLEGLLATSHGESAEQLEKLLADLPAVDVESAPVEPAAP